jgi:histidinol-phosphatase (PHP family)
MVLSVDYHTHPQGHQVRPYTLELLQPWIQRARERKVRSIAFTDHDRYYAGIDFEVVQRLREQNEDIEILIGIELDNDPISSAAGRWWVERHWRQLDFVLGSVHYFAGESEMFDRSDQGSQVTSRGTGRAFAEYITELERLIMRGGIDCLAHLDLVKIHDLHPESYDPASLFGPILKLAQRHGLAIEASTAGWRKKVGEQYPHEAILRLANEYGVPITTASDAHSYAQVGEDYDRLAAVLERAGVTRTATFWKHRQQSVIGNP